MISCIICSRRPDISAELKENTFFDLSITINSYYDFESIYCVLWEIWNHSLPLVRGFSIEQSEQETRTKLVELKRSIRQLENELDKISNSRAYRLGDFLLKPIRKLKRIFKH